MSLHTNMGVPKKCQALMKTLQSCSSAELLEELMSIDSWTFGKCELCHWNVVLNIFDDILKKAAMRVSKNVWTLTSDLPCNLQLKNLLLQVLRFTALLLEHSFSIHVYNSLESVMELLLSIDMKVVLSVCNILYLLAEQNVFSNNPFYWDNRLSLFSKLVFWTQGIWESSQLRISDFCIAWLWLPDNDYIPTMSTTLHFEYNAEDPVSSPQSTSCTSGTGNLNVQLTSKPGSPSKIVICVESKDLVGKTPAQKMDQLLQTYTVPLKKQVELFIHLLMAYSFLEEESRLQCVEARLQALSVLMYLNFEPPKAYQELIGEVTTIFEDDFNELKGVRSASLCFLTSVVLLHSNQWLQTVIENMGEGCKRLHVLWRDCIQSLSTSPMEAAAHAEVFAFLQFQHVLAKEKLGVQALDNGGLMQWLCAVLQDVASVQSEQLTLIVRTVWIIDYIITSDMEAMEEFLSNGYLTTLINRFKLEMNICRQQHPVQINPCSHQGHVLTECSRRLIDAPQEFDKSAEGNSDEDEDTVFLNHFYDALETKCLPERALVLKAILHTLQTIIKFKEECFPEVLEKLSPSLEHIITCSTFYGTLLPKRACAMVLAPIMKLRARVKSLEDSIPASLRLAISSSIN